MKFSQRGAFMKFKEMNLPNKLTTIRMICVPVVILLFILHMLYLSFDLPTDWVIINQAKSFLTLDQILIFVLFVAASITDYVDGHLARKNHIVSDYGKMMDPLADKLLVNTTMIGLIGFGFLKSPFLQKGSDILYLILTIVVILVIFRDFFVDSLRMQSVKNGVVVPASRFGKYKTATLMPGIAFLLLGSAHVVIYSIGAGLLILGGVFAIIGGVQYYLSIMPTLDK